ncbi:MAG: hypothetical protein IPK33_11175 [Gemmatimonadetes bacterium]|nr:hypothetical protein [Gemmatimonadota bacterium]
MAGELVGAVTRRAPVARLASRWDPRGNRHFDSEVRVDFALAPIGDGTLLPCQRAIQGDRHGRNDGARGWVATRALGADASLAPQQIGERRTGAPAGAAIVSSARGNGHANVGETSPTAPAAMRRDAAQRADLDDDDGLGEGDDEDPPAGDGGRR